MASQFTWGDALYAAGALQPIDRELLQLICRIPLAPVDLLQVLSGSGASYVHERLRALRGRGLLEAIQAPSLGGRPGLLHQFTELGLAVLALIQETDMVRLVRCYGLTERDRSGRLLRLPELLDAYHLLHLIARRWQAGVRLLAWQSPWRQRFLAVGRVCPVSLALPAYAALGCPDGTPWCYLLLPDAGLVPLGAYRATIAALLQLRASTDRALPPLVIVAGTPGRVAAWRKLLPSIEERLQESPLVCCVAIWSELPAVLAKAPAVAPEEDWVADVPPLSDGPPLSVQPGRHLRALAPGSRADGRDRPDGGQPQDAQTEAREQPAATGSDEQGKRPVVLSWEDVELLQLVGRHPFLTIEQIANLRNSNVPEVSRCCRRLLEAGLLGRYLLIGTMPQLVPTTAASEPVASDAIIALTPAGLEVLSANLGLPAHVLVKYLALSASGGPRRAERRWRDLGRRPEHTRGVNSLHVSWVTTVPRRQAHGWDDALEWRPAAACAHPLIRPDALLVYDRGGQRYGAFVEFDRGTEDRADYERKLGGYWEYHDSGAYEERYHGFPTILVMTVHKTAEDRIARALLAAGAGRTDLPVLLGCAERAADHRAGWLGHVWRGSEPTFTRRCNWPDRAPEPVIEAAPLRRTVR